MGSLWEEHALKIQQGKEQGRIPGMGNGGKWRKSCGQYPKSHLALSHRCLQRLERNSAKPAPMKLKLQQGRREALLRFSHVEAEGSAPKRGLGFFVTAWEGWRRKGEHRSDVRALKDNQRRFLSKERSQMFYKMGLKKPKKLLLGVTVVSFSLLWLLA